ncbi:hypothetical protein D9615_001405 [Tricholomella constricta]|uniref:Phosphoglycerate mutase n=1 Tax=Tricholomella constricta TaxID=117010 RepID=A0A8H5HKU2_9AGAR|nr:hypothetical protein D9615_001405 [Tricholomella constricta]
MVVERAASLQTGRTDIPLTSKGEQQIKDKAQRIVGDGFVDPKNLCTVFVSPRQRAHKTFHLLFGHYSELPHHILSEEVREWDYGDYEGLLSSEIKQNNPNWSIWADGQAYLPSPISVNSISASLGVQEESPSQIWKRVREYHRQYKEEGLNTRDVMIVAHGHFSRVLISRWICFPLALGTHFNVEPGSVAILSYNHNSMAEPALNALNLYADVL